MTYECCPWGDDAVETDDGDIIYPDLCQCICHADDEVDYGY